MLSDSNTLIEANRHGEGELHEGGLEDALGAEEGDAVGVGGCRRGVWFGLLGTRRRRGGSGCRDSRRMFGWEWRFLLEEINLVEGGQPPEGTRMSGHRKSEDVSDPPGLLLGRQ